MPSYRPIGQIPTFCGLGCRGNQLSHVKRDRGLDLVIYREVDLVVAEIGELDLRYHHHVIERRAGFVGLDFQVKLRPEQWDHALTVGIDERQRNRLREFGASARVAGRL
jgi:hypothetical protein